MMVLSPPPSRSLMDLHMIAPNHLPADLHRAEGNAKMKVDALLQKNINQESLDQERGDDASSEVLENKDLKASVFFYCEVSRLENSSCSMTLRPT